MPPPLPYPRSYWAIPDQLLAGFYPGDLKQEDTTRKLARLVKAGITLTVNLMEETETDHQGRPFIDYASRLHTLAVEAGQRIRTERFPIRDQSIPSPALMRTILDTIQAEISRGGKVYVHCWGGIGRTGTVIGCYLLETGREKPATVLDRMHALTAHASQFFWPTPHTQEQRDFVTHWKTSAL